MTYLPKNVYLQAANSLSRVHSDSICCSAISPASKIIINEKPVNRPSLMLHKCLVQRAVNVTTSLGASAQIRYAHTDLKVPDFSEYRKDQTKPNNVRSSDVEAEKKLPSYLALTAGAVACVYSGKYMVRSIVNNLGFAADALAISKVDIKLDDIPEGRNVTVTWRGKPLFVKHRTDEEIEREEAVDLAELRDPQKDSERASNPKFLIVVGVCTHLGCIPIANMGDYPGGYFCPCHGSHYDASGRIRKGPAPLNLEVPPVEYINDSLIVVG